MMLASILLVACLVSISFATNEAGLKFLEENKKKPGVITLASGLQYKVLNSGAGAFHPTKDSSCDCHYAGTLIDGTEFDSSYKRGSPTAFAPNQVIAGWTEAMQLMVEGDKWEMYIPSELAYGERGSGAKIPGGSALIFQMELIKINGNKIPAANCNPKDLTGCNEQEKEYVAKVAAWGSDKTSAEVARLNGMNKASMKPDLQTWIVRRAAILNKLLA